MSAIAIITARGGSKRIPRKNIKDFCGQPIIAYSIEAALESKIFDTVMVSTDDVEIAEIAKRYGAQVPFLRREETSNDFATTADVLKEVLSEYRRVGITFDEICCIYPTAPFVTAEKLRDAKKEMQEKGWSSVMPVVEFSFPPLRGMVVDEVGRLKYNWAEYAMMRSQDLEKIYHDCGQFYYLNGKTFEETGKLVTNNTGAIIVSEMEVQDIDQASDWQLAEMKYTIWKELN